MLKRNLFAASIHFGAPACFAAMLLTETGLERVASFLSVSFHSFFSLSLGVDVCHMLFSVSFVEFLMTPADVPVAAEILVKLIEIVVREPADQLFEQRVVGLEVCGLVQKLQLLVSSHSGVWFWLKCVYILVHNRSFRFKWLLLLHWLCHI